MKLRLVEKGFETYTGQFGILNFDRGLSVTDVNPHEARRVGGVMKVRWEDGSDPSSTQQMLDFQSVQADSAKTAAASAPVAEVKVAPARAYTEEELGKIADEKGIAGLREIADSLGVKGRSVADLIAGIMKVGK